jgi:hypothetical protein
MNAINMPGFSAEASLYKTSEHYQGAQSESAMRTITGASILAGREQILPQAKRMCQCPCTIMICDDTTGVCQTFSC